MKITVNAVSGCAKDVQVEVPADRVQVRVDDIFRRISQEAKLPGFRKGKVPMDVIKKEYKSNVREQVLQYELPEFFREAIKDQKLNPVAQPRITELKFEEGAPLTFIARVEVKPQFELKNYKGLKIKKEAQPVTEADVDKTLDDLRDRGAQFVPSEDEKRGAQKSDLVIIDFDGRIDGQPFKGGKATRYSVVLGSGNMMKEFEDALLGMKKGESKTFPMKFPDDYFGKEVAGKQSEFTVLVHEVKEKKLPIMDDEFVKEVSGLQTVAELRGKIKEDIQAHRSADQRAKSAEQIADQLIKAHAFDVPSSLVEMELQRLVQQGAERMKQQGIDVNKLGADQQKEFVDKLKPVSERNVHMALIVEKISEKENIHCEPKDFEAYVERVSRNVNQPPDTVKRYIQQQGNQESIQDWIGYEKTLDFLIAEATAD